MVSEVIGVVEGAEVRSSDRYFLASQSDSDGIVPFFFCFLFFFFFFRPRRPRYPATFHLIFPPLVLHFPLQCLHSFNPQVLLVAAVPQVVDVVNQDSVVVVAQLEVERVVPASRWNHTSMLVSSSPRWVASSVAGIVRDGIAEADGVFFSFFRPNRARNISLSPETLSQVTPSTARSEFPSPLPTLPPARTRKLSTVYGTLSDPSWPPVSSVVWMTSTSSLEPRSSTSVLPVVPRFPTSLTSSVQREPCTPSSSLTEVVVI